MAHIAPVPAPAPAPSRSSATPSEQDLRRLVEQDPRRFDAWYQLGVLALRQGRHPQVVECLGNAAALDPAQVEVHHYLATSYQALGQLDKALDHFHQVVCLKPEYAEAHNNWGIALAQLGRRQEAIAAFTQALHLKPDYPDVHNNWGIALVELGQLEAAVEHFRQALDLHPHYPEALNNLGIALGRLGRHTDALAAFEQAVRLRAGYADALNNLASLHRDLGHLDEATASYRRVLEVRPEHRDARQNLAAVLSRRGQIQEAITCLHECLLFHRDCPDTYNNLGILLCQRDRLDEAVAAFRQALRLKPDFAEVLNNLGNALLRQQKTGEALGCFSEALKFRSDYPQPYCNLGTALLQQGKASEAVGHYLEALRLQPDYADAHLNLGNAYRSLGRPGDAAGCYQEALRLQPDNPGARLNLGVALSEQGLLDEAVEVYQEVLRRKPDFGQAYNSLGVTRLHQGRITDGLAAFDQGLHLCPTDAEIHLNRALTLLLQGDYEAGWVEYEWRWKLKRAAACPYPQPQWDGSPLPRGTIVVWSEQGLGDSLQFARYAALVKERVGTVLLDCPAPLRGLMASCPGVDSLVDSSTPVIADVQAPLLSLPRLLGTTLASIPSSVPYVFADASLRQRWRDKVPAGPGLRVGIVWQGNPQFGGDRYRSVPLSRFRGLAAVPGVHLFSLQKGKGSEQLPELAQELDITDLGSQISGDFCDTAAAMASLDLVLGVDTAVVHLAGALGVPVWVLLPFNPDWRWLLGRTDSVWYPSARLFRQARWGDWDDVFAPVADALHQQARRPLLRCIAVPLDLAELVESSVREELHTGRRGVCARALQEACVLDTPEVAALAARLKGAHEATPVHSETLPAHILLRSHHAPRDAARHAERDDHFYVAITLRVMRPVTRSVTTTMKALCWPLAPPGGTLTLTPASLPPP
jgi:tetratricopeptide (TPR) repeat protein